MNDDEQLLEAGYKLIAILVDRLGGEVLVTEEEITQIYLRMEPGGERLHISRDNETVTLKLVKE